MALLVAVLVAGVLTLALLVIAWVAIASRQRREAQRAVEQVEEARGRLEDEGADEADIREALEHLSALAIADYAHDTVLAARVQAVLHAARDRLTAQTSVDDRLRTRIRRLSDVLGTLLEGEPEPIEDPLDSLRDRAEAALRQNRIDPDIVGRIDTVIAIARAEPPARIRDREYAVELADEVLRMLRSH